MAEQKARPSYMLDLPKRKKEYVSERELARIVGISDNTIREMRLAGEAVPAFQYRKTIRWNVDDFLAQNRRRQQLKEVS